MSIFHNKGQRNWQYRDRSNEGRRGLLLVVLLVLTPALLVANPFLSDTQGSAPQQVATQGTPPVLVTIQLGFRDRIAEALTEFKTKPNPSTIAVILFASFLYGIVHAAGPGHRKSILFSLFLAKKAKPWEPLVAGILTSALHAGSALALIGILSALSGVIANITHIDSSSVYMEGLSFTLLAAIFFILAVLKLYHGVKDIKGKDIEGDKAASGAMQNPKSWYGIVILTSLVPCPGATMIMMLSLYLQLIVTGFFAVLAMSAGMALVITVVAYLAYFGRKTLFNRLKNQQRSLALVSGLLELASYVFITLFSFYAAWPFLVSLLEGGL